MSSDLEEKKMSFDLEEKKVFIKLCGYQVKPHPGTARKNEPCVWKDEDPLITVFGWHPEDHFTEILKSLTLDQMILAQNIIVNEHVSGKIFHEDAMPFIEFIWIEENKELILKTVLEVINKEREL